MAIDLYEKSRERLAREHGGVAVDRASAVRFALAFPNVYRLGMASLGYQLIHEILNNLPNASCERVFLPDQEDIDEYTRSRTELFTIESLSRLSEFNVVAFSVYFELDYINLLHMLKLANLPLRSSERDESRPLIIAGGPCATFNPEPLVEFIDAFVIGDGEDTLRPLVDAIEATQSSPREDMLEALSQVPGVYVPSLYKYEYNDSGELLRVLNRPLAPEKVQRAITMDLSKYSAGSTIRTSEAEFGDIRLIEVSRGCGRHCRFCVAGYINRPPWPREIGIVPEEARLGLVGAAVFDHPEAERICRDIVDAGGEFTVSSVRMETVTPSLAKLMAQGGQKTLTIAPEAATARLRSVINKTSTEEDIYKAVSAARDAGISRVKLYFMIGLPTETDDDIAAISQLLRQLSAEFPSISFQVSASCFVPKPWTPFQWCAMERESVLKRRYSTLRKSILAIKGVKFSGESPRLAVIQGCLARGDKQLADMLIEAMENGGDYHAAIRETGIDIADYIYRMRDKKEVFPWEHVDARVKKSYLWREYTRALKGTKTAPCNVDKCKACGVCQ